MSNEGGNVHLKCKRRKKLPKRNTTNLIMMEYDGMENIRKMLYSMGYILKSKNVEDNELSQLSSVLCENVSLLEDNVKLKAKIEMMEHTVRYKDVLVNSYRHENLRLKKRITYLQRGLDNALHIGNNCDVSIDSGSINLKINNTINITLDKSYINHDLADCIICFAKKYSVKLPCSHYICCDCVIYAKDTKMGESMLLDKCPYCRRATNPTLIRIDLDN